jgi:hypothetical protein
MMMAVLADVGMKVTMWRSVSAVWRFDDGTCKLSYQSIEFG